jgi:DNA-binding MarR family transcriptional regulator
MDTFPVALSLEKAARQIYEIRGPKAFHPGQWAVLRFLNRSPYDRRTVGGVARHLGMTHAPASRAVASLAAKDLIIVESDSEDLRVRRIKVTDAGRELLENDPLKRLATIIASLPTSHQRGLSESLAEILWKFGAQSTGGGLRDAQR